MVPDPAAVLAEVWRGVAGEPAELGRVGISGVEPVLTSRFPVATAAAATVAAATLAVAGLWEERGGPPGPVEVGLEEAAVAFRSEAHLRVDGTAPGLWAPLSGDVATADGWVRLHANFPAHRDAVLAVLGVPEEPAAVTAAASSWSAEALERAVIDAGGAAAALRSPATWRASPPGRAVAGLPLVGVRRLGDAPARPVPPAERPLDGVRVLDLTRVIAGPVCGRALAGWGADVLRVGAEHLPEIVPLLIDTGVGKSSCWLDLRDGEGRAALRALVAEADVVVQAFRPGALDRLGFGPSALAELRPGIVAVSLSAYGSAGPWAGRRGFDSLVQVATGIAHEGAAATGAERPVPLPAQALDHGSGWLAALGAVMALRRVRAEGGSWLVEVSLARTAAWLDGLGRIDGLGAGEPTEDDVADLLEERDSAFGRLTLVRQPGRIAGHRPRADRPPPLPGADPPAWQGRGW